MNDRLCFVQFMHPGGEHKPQAGGHMAWNVGRHLRKFLVADGRRISGEKVLAGKLCFWGEWEAQSTATRLLFRPSGDYPEYVHQPYYSVPRSIAGLQNTDPFVFGDCFHYTGCQQNTKRGPTQLRHLSVGSVILFGSHKAGRFQLDSVFVVKRYVDHSPQDYMRVLKGIVSSAYWDVTVLPWYQGRECGPGESYRLYYGATYDSPLEGMYSFFPARPYQLQSGFERPTIALVDVVNGTLTQGMRLNPQASIAHVRELWQSVVQQVTAQQLELGVFAELPPRR